MKPNTALKFARMDAGFTREALAQVLGVSTMTVYRWERGENSPTPRVRRRLCKLLQLPEQALRRQEPKKEECWLKDSHSPFLTDPCLPINQEPLIGQQPVLKEIEQAQSSMLGLVGLPGSGKTALEQALTSLPTLGQQGEGLFWATIGQNPHPLRHLQRWLLLLGERALPESVEEAQDRLRVLLHGRKVLVILDDLWNAEDIIPYQLPHCRYIVTTRLPIVANTVCDHIFRPRALTEMQAFHLLSHDLPIALVREHREILRALCQQVGNLPLAVEQIGKHLRREARSSSQRRFQEALTHLFHPASYLHLQISPGSCSLAASIKRSEAWLSSSAQHAFSTLATHFLTAPSTFSEQQVVDLIQTSRQFQLHDLDHLLDVVLLIATAGYRYQIHPVIAAYARLLAENKPEITE